MSRDLILSWRFYKNVRSGIHPTSRYFENIAACCTERLASIRILGGGIIKRNHAGHSSSFSTKEFIVKIRIKYVYSQKKKIINNIFYYCFGDDISKCCHAGFD